jgi:hypothetical protein
MVRITGASPRYCQTLSTSSTLDFGRAEATGYGTLSVDDEESPCLL